MRSSIPGDLRGLRMELPSRKLVRSESSFILGGSVQPPGVRVDQPMAPDCQCTLKRGEDARNEERAVEPAGKIYWGNEGSDVLGNPFNL